MTRGTLPLKLRLPGCEPIRRQSGTHDPKMRDKLVTMIRSLQQQGRPDLVNAIARGTLHPLQVYGLWRFNRLEDLPHADDLPLFRDTWPGWLERMDCSDEHRHNTDLYFQRFEKMMKPDATIGAIVDTLKDYREKMVAHPRAFNLAKSNVQAFIKGVLGRRHRYYHEVQDIPGMRITTRRERHPLTPDQLRLLVERLGEPYGPMAWTMATTGMHWKEYSGRWEREGEGLRIFGTKATGRDGEGRRNRLIPIVSMLHRPIGTIYAFRWHLDQVTPRIVPYDLRRTYAGIMVDAQVPAPRRALYMGHSPKSITEVYERQEVLEYLERDARKMREVIGEPPDGPRLRLAQA